MGRNLNKLRLPKCRLWEFQLKTLLDYTSNLEELECETQNNIQDFGDLCLSNELLDALSKVSWTLRTLKLSLRTHSEFHPGNGIHTAMGSMENFRHLRYEKSPFDLCKRCHKAKKCVCRSLKIPSS
jgi:hypothetical protein